MVFSFVTAQEGSTARYTADNIKPVEELYKTIPEMQRFNAMAGFPTVADGLAILRLKPWEERTRKQQEITQELAPKLAQIPGVRAFATNPPSLGQSPRNRPVEFVIMSSAPYEQIARPGRALHGGGLEEPGAHEPRHRPAPGQARAQGGREPRQDRGRGRLRRSRGPHARDDARRAGRSRASSATASSTTSWSRWPTRDRRTPGDISDIYVRGKGNEMIQLSNLVNVRESVAPKSLNHFNRIRAVTISATLAPGLHPGTGAHLHERRRRRRSCRPRRRPTSNGQSREFRDSSTDIYFVFVLALAFIYLVLAAQFESFIDPFVIMLTVPLSMTGRAARPQALRAARSTSTARSASSRWWASSPSTAS